MKHKIIEPILVAILLATLAVMSSTEKASAPGTIYTIYIRENGDIDPPTAPIQRDGDVYTFTSSIDGNITVQKDNVVIDGNNYLLNGSGRGFGFNLTNRINVTIRNSRIANFDYGISLYESDGNIIAHNSLTNNYWAAIFLSNSSSNQISRNTVLNNAHDGILLWERRTQNNIITGNNVSNNGASDGGDGISIGLRASYNTIINNIVSGNSGAGIALGYEWSTGNIITGNNITLNEWTGIYMAWETESGNQLYHNNINNNFQVNNVEATNTWDNGYPSCGNYWSDCTGIDLFKGPYQNITGSDGVYDNPYTIDPDNKDNYPLTKPWSTLRGDIDSDGDVDYADFIILAGAYGSNINQPAYRREADTDSDGDVDYADFIALAGNYGQHT